MKIFFSVLLLLVLIFTVSSCYYDKEDTLYPYAGSSLCDTSTVTYSSTIVPLLNANCNNCHQTALASGGVILDTYAGVQTVAANGWLMSAITHASGFIPMPKNGNKLPDCTIAKFRIWVNQGAPDN